MLVDLVNDTEYIDMKLYNVIGTIKGALSECVVLGNHHDPWSAGCVDPDTGSSAMNEVVNRKGSRSRLGTSQNHVPQNHVRTQLCISIDVYPLTVRSILASWDGEEYGLLGTTAWATQNSDHLKRNCIAYINVDESTNGGDILGPVGSPLLAETLYEAAKVVPSPLGEEAEVDNGWCLLDIGSDFTVSQHHLGISSTDLAFNAGPRHAVYQYHTKYDSTLWMERFGDPGYQKHKAMAQLWGLVAFRLASNAVLALSATKYAQRLAEGFASMNAPAAVDASELQRALARFHEQASHLDGFRAGLSEREPTDEEVWAVNSRYVAIERGFLHFAGLSQRPWYKHLAFGPGLWEGYGGVVFPAIADAMFLKDVAVIQAAVDLTTAGVNRVTEFIRLP
ncbi:hypothetical protein BJX66DRAFT_338935 [Aspergillus keveii]|uniref:Glutamate carboxypeptidase n=1 Tax=Aspergillus keveii TaxID=714993 RepID=A0ABR4G2W7_9EURO